MFLREHQWGIVSASNRLHAGRRALTRVGRRRIKRVRSLFATTAKHLRRVRRATAMAAIGCGHAVRRIRRFSFRRFAKASPPARRVWMAGIVARHPWEYYVRRRTATQLAGRPPGFTIPRADGYARFDERTFPQVPAILARCRHIYLEEKRGLVKPPPTTSTRQKGYLIELLTDEDLVRHPELVDFCLSRAVVEAVTQYLGTLPILRRVGLWLSFAAPTDGASRLFHLDPEDFTQVRMFLNVIDITTPQGPLTFLPATVSSGVLNALWRDERAAGRRTPQLRRWTDAEIDSRSTMSQRVDLSGPAGSGAFVDTSRCLHYGSRMQPGAMHLVFQAQFLRYHFPFATATNRFDPARAGGDPVTARLLMPRPGFEANWHDR